MLKEIPGTLGFLASDTGEIIHYPSASQFVQQTGLSKKAITVRLKHDGESNTVSEYAGFQFAYADLGLIAHSP